MKTLIEFKIFNKDTGSHNFSMGKSINVTSIILQGSELNIFDGLQHHTIQNGDSIITPDHYIHINIINSQENCSAETVNFIFNKNSCDINQISNMQDDDISSYEMQREHNDPLFFLSNNRSSYQRPHNNISQDEPLFNFKELLEYPHESASSLHFVKNLSTLNTQENNHLFRLSLENSNLHLTHHDALNDFFTPDSKENPAIEKPQSKWRKILHLLLQ